MSNKLLFAGWTLAARPYAIQYAQYLPVLLAQAALESGYGKSDLYRLYNNVSGMKIGTGKGFFIGSVNMTTREVIRGKEMYIRDNFRTYKSVSQSFQDLAFRHQRFGIKFSGNVNQYINDIVKSGYATAPNYGEIIKAVIKSNHLEAYADSPGTKKTGLFTGLLLGLGLIYVVK